jgi:hypothetical protein
MKANWTACPPVVAISSPGRAGGPSAVADEEVEVLRGSARRRVGEHSLGARQTLAHHRRGLEIGLADVEVQDPHPAPAGLVGHRHELADRRRRHGAATGGDGWFHGRFSPIAPVTQRGFERRQRGAAQAHLSEAAWLGERRQVGGVTGVCG